MSLVLRYVSILFKWLSCYVIQCFNQSLGLNMLRFTTPSAETRGYWNCCKWSFNIILHIFHKLLRFISVVISMLEQHNTSLLSLHLEVGVTVFFVWCVVEFRLYIAPWLLCWKILKCFIQSWQNIFEYISYCICQSFGKYLFSARLVFEINDICSCDLYLDQIDFLSRHRRLCQKLPCVPDW